jgi:hypothetical protein
MPNDDLFDFIVLYELLFPDDEDMETGKWKHGNRGRFRITSSFAISYQLILDNF